MAEVKARPAQSGHYKAKSAAQVVSGVVALVGFDVEPEQIAALLGGIELGYIEVRIAYIRRAVVWVLKRVGLGKLAALVGKVLADPVKETPDA